MATKSDLDVIAETKTKPKLEIYYNGYFYDVTDFVDRHPGGNIIKFYTEKGEDATQAIDQFHYRSKGKVAQILKTFKKRRAEPSERGLDEKTLKRHEELSRDFQKLFEELEEEGYFKPSYRHVILRLLECACLTMFGYHMIFVDNSWFYFQKYFFGCFYIGAGLSRYGWLMHEAGHKSLTGNPKLDNAIQRLCVCFMLGGSSAWWNSQHNRHHAMPQRLQHDVDLATLPFVAFHKRTVRNRREINGFFIRYQFIFYWTLDLYIVTILWRFFISPAYQLKKKLYLEMFLNLQSLILIYRIGFTYYFIGSYWFALFLGINFALNHSHLDVADKPTHWIEYSMTHTVDIKSNMLVDYWMGYLNFQIEHHLFPTMPQFRQKEVSARVRALAEKHGLPYRVLPYMEACKLAFKNLYDVGKELTDEKQQIQ